MIDVRDDLRHVPSRDEDYSESKWFAFYDGAKEFWISSRIGLEPNHNRANRWVVAGLKGEVLCCELATGLDLPSADWNELQVPGLSYQTLVPMLRYSIGIDLPALQVEVNWTASTPVFDYHDCQVPLPPSLAAEHYEQSGTVTGVLQAGGKEHRLEGVGHRDHSWGVRKWEGFRSWIAFMAQLSPGLFLHLERFEDEFTGTTTHGFLSRRGENLPLSSATIELDMSNGTRFPRTFRITVPHLGPEPVSGRVHVTCPLEFGRCVVAESYGSFRFAGQEVLGIVEYGFTY